MKRALKLLELLVALAIIGTLAAVAIPRLGQATPGADDADPRGRLNVLRCAIELYYQDHGAYPAQKGDGQHAAGTEAAFVSQLTSFTDENGVAARTKDATHRFGPYLRMGIPACPVPPRQNQSGVVIVSIRPAWVGSAGAAGWVYNCRTGAIVLNSNAPNPDGVRYDEY